MPARSSLPPRARLSVVVPTRNRPAMLATCLERLASELSADDEVIVVDSASTQSGSRAAAEAVGAHFVQATISGASVARNLGWRTASNELVAFIDDDILVEPGWGSAAAASLADSSVAYVIGSVHAPPGQSEVGNVVSLFTDAEDRDLPIDDPPVRGASCNLVIRRAALVTTGGFDERMGPGRWFVAEDLELFDRLHHAGLRGRYVSDVRVLHDQHRVGREITRVYWFYGLGMGARLAKLVRLDRRAFWAVLPKVTRIRSGLRTATAEVRGTSESARRSFLPPIVWRVGVLVGFVVGLVHLRGDRR